MAQLRCERSAQDERGCYEGRLRELCKLAQKRDVSRVAIMIAAASGWEALHQTQTQNTEDI